jgi:hypothetical protein
VSESACEASGCVRGEAIRRNFLYAARTRADIYVPVLALKKLPVEENKLCYIEIVELAAFV